MASKNLLSPIAMLPPELMRDIFSFVACTAEWRRATLRLSQVSQGFRRAVLDMSRLFTHADWDHWAPPLLDLWCQRARAQLLTVNLSRWTLHHLSTGKDPLRQALLESLSRRWGTLDLHILFWDRSVIGLVERLLQCACPALHTLSLWQPNSAGTMTLRLRLDCLPSLRTLCLSSIPVVFSASPAPVTEVEYHYKDSRDLPRLLGVVSSCNDIQRLTLCNWDFAAYADHSNAFPATQVVLPSLTHLSLRGDLAGMIPRMTQFLICCVIPNLENLALQPYRWISRTGDSLCRNVVRSSFCSYHMYSRLFCRRPISPV